jgi:hypothetical protein
MTVSDVVSGLLARLDELERAARAVEPLGHNFGMGSNRQDEKFTHARVSFASEDGRPRTAHGNEPQHFNNWNPDDVLRLCRAHRDIIEIYKRQYELEAAGAGQSTGTQGVLVYAVALLEDVIEALARGYGVEEQADG